MLSRDISADVISACEGRPAKTAEPTRKPLTKEGAQTGRYGVNGERRSHCPPVAPDPSFVLETEAQEESKKPQLERLEMKSKASLDLCQGSC